MNKITKIHREAMAISDHAFSAKREAKPLQAAEFFRQAFAKEALAAELTLKLDGEELSKGVLCRSAGWLAVHGGDLDEGERFAELGLAAKPPAGIARELRELRAEIAKRKGAAKKFPAKRATRATSAALKPRLKRTKAAAPARRATR